jgi:hypothetical protein
MCSEKVFGPPGPCQDSVGKCLQISSCKEWVQCVNDCFGDEWATACFRGCDMKFAPAKPQYQPIYACLCGSCAGPCAGAC